jgi:hypothetical protein
VHSATRPEIFLSDSIHYKIGFMSCFVINISLKFKSNYYEARICNQVCYQIIEA